MTAGTVTILSPNVGSAHPVWMAIHQALAGAAPSAYWGGDDTQADYNMREDLKRFATQGRAEAAALDPSFRAPYWLAHAYSHWWRNWTMLNAMDAHDFDEVFPDGINFRRYLGAWLWSVGVASLSMTASDLEAVHAATGVAPLPHPNLPIGRSDLRTDLLRTSSVDALPAMLLKDGYLDVAFKKDGA